MKATRFTACLLALLMTVSCGSGTVGTPSDSTDDKSSNDSDEITEVELKPDIPDDLTFDDRTINILTWNHYETVEFTTESENGEVINDALFKRNRDVEDRLKIKLNFIDNGGGRFGDSTWMDTLRNSVLAFDGSYDIVAGHSINMGTLTMNGIFTDLLGLDYLDFTKPWWRSALLEDATIRNKLFFCVGDLAVNAYSTIQGVFFNQRLIDEYSF